LYGREDAVGYRHSPEENKTADNRPEEHRARFFYRTWLASRGDELITHEYEHEDNDDSADAYDESEDALKKLRETVTVRCAVADIERVEEEDATA
jgi:hypothetical protein